MHATLQTAKDLLENLFMHILQMYIYTKPCLATHIKYFVNFVLHFCLSHPHYVNTGYRKAQQIRIFFLICKSRFNIEAVYGILALSAAVF